MAALQPWQAARLDTPGAEKVAHFNNAGAALPCRAVLEAQHRFLDLEATTGGYEAVEQETPTLRRPYQALANMLNCSSDEIAVTPSATHAWNQVFYGLPHREGDRILTCQHEYGSNYIAYMQVAKRAGVKIEVIPEDDKGDIDIEALQGLCSQGQRPSLIAITHIPTNCGRVYSAQAVGEVARTHSIPYLLDACQSVGQIPLDVATLGCDWLTGTSRKYLRGPRGLGFLFASRSIMKRFPEPAALDLTGAEWQPGGSYNMVDSAKRYEFYEKNFAAVAALGVAVDYYLGRGPDAVWARVQELAALLRIRLAAVPGVTVHDAGRMLCGIVAFTKEGVAPTSVCEQLRALAMNVKQTPLTSTRLDFEARQLPAEGLVRASVHYYNTEQEVMNLVEAVGQLRATKGLRGGVNSALGLLLGSSMWPVRR